MNEDDFERELYQLAIHEAGHVVVAWCYGWGVECASIVGEQDSHGRTLLFPPARDTTYRGIAPIVAQSRGLEIRVRICFGGPLAEARFAGNGLDLVSAHEDFAKGVLLLRQAAETHDEREKIGDYLFNQTKTLVRRRWKEISLLAGKLVANGTLFSEEIETVMGPRRLEFLSRRSTDALGV